MGLTVATRFPDLRGSLSRWHFRSLGMPARVIGSNIAAAEWLIGRIERWSIAAAGELRIIRTKSDLEACLLPDAPLGVLIGVQGGHALDGRLANLERLSTLGVRMLAPAHTMDNGYAGSGTGVNAGGLTEQGRELIAAMEEQSMLVDLAHMSPRAIKDSLAVTRRPQRHQPHRADQRCGVALALAALLPGNAQRSAGARGAGGPGGRPGWDRAGD